MKKLKKYLKGFTLVELIIVITILAILTTIAFLSFQNYTRDARDGNRIATIKNIEKGLELFTLKTGNFPTPDNPTTFTGGLEGNTQIHQGVVGENVARVINMNTIPLDPKDNSLSYVYSTFGQNHLYYQIAIDRENLQSSLFPQVYASSKSSIVQGNYKFDPSLPSLILVENEALTNSGIFSPEVCFVVDGRKNSLDNCVEKKSEMSLRELDSSLVGYWDMETTFSSGGINYLKDLSGNGNDGAFSGGLNPNEYGTLSLSSLGKGLKFNGISSFIELSQTGISDYRSISALINIEDNLLLNDYWGKAIFHVFGGSFNSYELKIAPDFLSHFQIGDGIAWRGVTSNEVITSNKYFLLTGVFDYHNNVQSVFINGKKVGEYYNIDKAGNPINTNSVFPRIGTTSSNSTNRFFQGIIDDIKIYNRVLTDEEIKQQAKIAGLYGQ